MQVRKTNCNRVVWRSYKTKCPSAGFDGITKRNAVARRGAPVTRSGPFTKRNAAMRVGGSQNELRQGGLALLQNEMPSPATGDSDVFTKQNEPVRECPAMPPGSYITNCDVMPRRRTRVMRVAGSQNELQQGGLAVLQNEMAFRGLRRNYKTKCRDRERDSARKSAA